MTRTLPYAALPTFGMISQSPGVFARRAERRRVIGMALTCLLMVIFFVGPLSMGPTVTAANPGAANRVFLRSSDPDTLALTDCVDIVAIRSPFLSSSDLRELPLTRTLLVGYQVANDAYRMAMARHSQHVDHDSWFRFVVNPVTTDLVFLC